MKTKTYFSGSNIALLAEANKKAGLQCIGCLQYKRGYEIFSLFRV